MRTLTFNSAASAALADRNTGKVRIAAREGVAFIRPTDRKVSPHLADIKGSKSKGFSVEITDTQAEKLGLNSLTDKATFGLRADKYGWMALSEAGAEGNIENAEVSVTVTADEATEA